MNETSLGQMKDKFTPGTVFRMSRVGFAQGVKKEYNSAPKTQVVSMLNTTWTAVLTSAGKPRMPEPPIPIVASMDIEAEQTFDALALIHDVSETAGGGQTQSGQKRMRCTVLLNDGSEKENSDKVCHLPVTIFADAKSNGEEPSLFQDLREAAKNSTAMAFFGIQGKKSTSDTDGDN